MQPLRRRLNPVLEAVTLPVLRPQEHDASGLNEQWPQVAVPAFGYAAKDRPTAGRGLFRHDPKPGGEVAAFGEDIALADAGHRGTGDDRADAGHGHQPHGAFIGVRELLDLYRVAFNALINLPTIAIEVLDRHSHARCQPVDHSKRV